MITVISYIALRYDDPMTREEEYTEDDIDNAHREGYEEACEEIIGFVRNL